MHGQLTEQATVGVTHAHHGLVEIDALLVKTAVLEAVHHIVIHLLRIEVLRAVADGGERGDTTGQSFLHEVVAKVHVVLLTYGDGNIDRTCPVALCNHLEHHEVTLV